MSKVIDRRTLLLGTAAGFATMTFGARAASHSAKEHVVEIISFKFVPASLEVKVGDTITWINRDGAPHTATADDGSWNTGTLRKDVSGSIVVGSGMANTYHCNFHPNMKAQLTVVTG